MLSLTLVSAQAQQGNLGPTLSGSGGSGGSATNAQPPSTILTNLSGIASTNWIAFTNSPFFDIAGAAQNATNNLTWVATNDQVIATFIATNNIIDKSAQDDLYLAAQDCKAFGFWTNLVDAWPLESRFNPTNLVSLRGVPFTFSNALFNPKGATFWGTNHIEQIMPQMTNFTVCLMYSEAASNIDAYDTTANYGMLAEMINTNDQSSVILHGFSIYRGNRLYTSYGTNYWGTNNPYQQTNQISMIQSGEMRNDESMAPITEQCICFGYSNGWVTMAINGNMAAFNQASYATNTILENTNISYITTFRIGGQDTNWNRFMVNCTNLFGATVMNAMVFNLPLSTNLAICAYRMATDLEPYAKATELAGSSILNNQRAAAGGTPGTPLTNCLAYQDMLLNPDRLVIQSASPGSFLLNWTNCVYGTTPCGYPYTPSILYLNPKKYTTLSFKTDAFRNDQANGADTIPGSAQKMSVYFTNLYAHKIDFDLIITPWTYAVGASSNLSFIQECFYFKTNFPLTHLYNFAALVSSNRLAAASQDNPPTHPDAVNPSGLLMNIAMDDVINGKPTVYDQPPDSIASGGLVRDASITNMNQLGFVVKAQDGSTRITYDLSAGTNYNATNLVGTIQSANLTGNAISNAQGFFYPASGAGSGNVVSNNLTFLTAIYNPGGTNSYLLIQSNQVQVAGGGNVMQFSNAAIILPDLPSASGLQPGYGILEQGGGVGAAQIGFNAHNVVVNSNLVVEGTLTVNGLLSANGAGVTNVASTNLTGTVAPIWIIGAVDAYTAPSYYTPGMISASNPSQGAAWAAQVLEPSGNYWLNVTFGNYNTTVGTNWMIVLLTNNVQWQLLTIGPQSSANTSGSTNYGPFNLSTNCFVCALFTNSGANTALHLTWEVQAYNIKPNP